MTNKKLLSTFSVLALVGTLLVATPTKVSAFNGDIRENGLVQRLLERFGLNQDEVNEVVSQYRTERQQEMQQKHAERMSELVQEGNLTQGQADSLNAKHQEWQHNKPDYSNMTHEERHEAMESHREEMQDWAKSQGIDLSQLQLGKMAGMGRGGYNK